MSNYTDQDRAIALIGIYQAAKLVFDLATTGKIDEKSYQTSINSLFMDNPSSTLDVYGNEAINLQVGVKTLLSQMGASDAEEIRNLEVTRYALNLILLERSLAKDGDALAKVAKTLDTATNQRAHFDDWHENVIASIARAYTENVSQLSPRIMVKGQHGHLQKPQNANKIRALLLAGIRSAMLWRQVGGTRWGLLWNRKKYLQNAQALYRSDSNSSDNNRFKSN
ncbi:MAG: high frequency lysogenization protein HflD [Thiomicrospira sp.]|uniref:high frequency lysogenization protein HflD n=1 Tax=Thiomicrospira sp. TaxID=935 RepID=UPI001A061061|nr:high frequency lysogenization protein HflD [Thiomicrospira sp.]MBE0493965.1 high frequency lysogenization protein HflD [Thiomicrospira sp.]